MLYRFSSQNVQTPSLPKKLAVASRRVASLPWKTRRLYKSNGKEEEKKKRRNYLTNEEDDGVEKKKKGLKNEDGMVEEKLNK